MRTFWKAVAGAAVLGVTLPAMAGRPFATEDAGVLDKGSCEFEAFVSRATARDTPKQSGWWVQPGCGVGLNSQLALGAGRTRSEGESTLEAALVGKTFLRELKDDQPGVTIAYQVGGQKAPGNSFKHEGTEIRGVVTAPVGPGLLHANLGWSRSQSERSNSTIWAVAFEMPAVAGVKGLDVGVETYGDDRSEAWLGVGARYAIVPNKVFVDSSYAIQTNSARARLLTVGLKVAFE